MLNNRYLSSAGGLVSLKSATEGTDPGEDTRWDNFPLWTGKPPQSIHILYATYRQTGTELALETNSPAIPGQAGLGPKPLSLVFDYVSPDDVLSRGKFHFVSAGARGEIYAVARGDHGHLKRMRLKPLGKPDGAASPLDYSGTYARKPVENDWHRGSIEVDERGVPAWRNAADVEWKLTPELAESRHNKQPGSVYYNSPDGKALVLKISGGKVAGFSHNGDYYERTGDVAEARRVPRGAQMLKFADTGRQLIDPSVATSALWMDKLKFCASNVDGKAFFYSTSDEGDVYRYSEDNGFSPVFALRSRNGKAIKEDGYWKTLSHFFAVGHNVYSVSSLTGHLRHSVFNGDHLVTVSEIGDGIDWGQIRFMFGDGPTDVPPINVRPTDEIEGMYRDGGFLSTLQHKKGEGLSYTFPTNGLAGEGWDYYQFVFGGATGEMYIVGDETGENRHGHLQKLLDYKLRPRNSDWPLLIDRNDWRIYKSVFSDGHGNIFAVAKQRGGSELLRFREQDGRVVPMGVAIPQLAGNDVRICATTVDGRAVIYATNLRGDVVRYAQNDRDGFEPPKIIGTGYHNAVQFFASGNSVYSLEAETLKLAVAEFDGVQLGSREVIGTVPSEKGSKFMFEYLLP